MAIDIISRKELKNLQDDAAENALRARARVEAAVDAGDLPVWVLDTCDQWERSAMLYGAARAKLAQRGQRFIDEAPASTVRH